MKKFFKWFGIALGGLVLLILAAAIIVPLVFDVDKYRPQIVQAAQERINGKLELGKLKLSLWGQIRVEVEGITLLDTAGRKIVSATDAYFYLPFFSILSGSPEMIFKMDHPSVAVIKNKLGKLNVMSLLKPAVAPPWTPPASGTSAGSAAPSEPTNIPGIVSQARLGVELSHAVLSYKDELTALDSTVSDLNLVIKDLSLTRTTALEMWADLDTKMGKTLSVHGPARLTAHAKPEIVQGAFDHAVVDLHVDLDGLDIASGAFFEKRKGMATNLDLKMTASPREAKIESLVVHFFNAEIKASGMITHLGELPSTPGVVAPSPIVKMAVSSNEIDLQAWNQLVPLLKEFELAGQAKFDATAEGPSDKLGYKAKLSVHALTAKAPNLKAQPRFDAVVDVVTDQIQNMQVTMKSPGNEMTFKGKLVSFTKPQGSFDLTSSGMDLDQLIIWPPPVKPGVVPPQGAAAPGNSATATQGGAGGGTPPVADLDASVDSLRINPAAAAATMVTNFNIKMLKAKGILMTDLIGKLYLSDLVAGLDGFAMKMWNGTVKANFASHLKPKMPTYTFSTVVDSLDLKKAVEQNVAMVKNTLVGKLHYEMNGSGASFNPDPAKGNLKAKGSMKVENATFGTVDVVKMASEAINKGLEKVGEKIPQAKGRSVGAPNGKESRYDLISSSFTISDGKFVAPDFATRAAINNGIDLKGHTEVGLKDYSLKTRWEVIDTFDLLKGKGVSVDAGGVKVDHILAEGNGPVKFVVNAGCTCFQPCYSYTEVPEYLAKVALNNVSGAVGGRAKEELRKRIQSIVPAIPKAAPPAVQDAVQGLGKKLFGN